MGEIENRPPDPSLLRISDSDRQKVAEVLRDAAGEGRIDLEELDERLELTWGAKTYADLVPITADLHLPAHPQPADRARAPYAAGVPAVGPRLVDRDHGRSASARASGRCPSTTARSP